MKTKSLYILVVGVFLLAMSVAPALADGRNNHNQSTDTVTVENQAFVGNYVTANADTGDNQALGSYAGDGGNGGAISSGGDEVEDSTTGSGGTGGRASDGGVVMSGDATAVAGVMNNVNTTRTTINRTQATTTVDDASVCNSCGDTSTRVENGAMVMNGVKADARTGDNLADGSYAGEGGNGGAISSGGDEVDGSHTGSGGNGGTSGLGGLVQSGSSNSYSFAVNIVNRSITRVQR